MKVSLVYPNLKGEKVPGLGLAIVASCLVKQGHEVEILDFTWERKRWQQYLRERLKKSPPDAIGVSSLIYDFHYGLMITREIKKLMPDVPILFGGIYPSLEPHVVMKYPEIDALLVGEGEQGMNEWLAAISGGREFEQVAGLYWRRSGEVVKNPLRPYQQNIDSVPFPDWDLWDIKRYLGFPVHPGFIYVTGSRGCPFQCTFCTMPVFATQYPGKYVRFRSPENIIEEITINKEKYWEHGFRMVSFSDNIFGMKKDLFNRFCDLYIEAGLNRQILWSANVTANLVTREWARRAKEAGCLYAKVGVEAGDDYIRQTIYKKRITLEQIREANTILKEFGILRQYNFMLGGPGETKQTLQRSIDLIEELDGDVPMYSIYSPLPRTAVLKTIEDLGGKILSDGWKDTPNFWFNALVDTPLLKASEVKRFMRWKRAGAMWRFAREGFRMKGLRFVWDFLYCVLYLRWRYDFVYIYVYIYTIFQYKIKRWVKENQIQWEV